MGKIVGIDLGTTNSVIAHFEAGNPVVIPNKEGSRITPSVVAFTDTEVLVGERAKRQAALNSERTIFSAKRFMGRRFSEVDAEIKNVPYRVVAGADESARFQIGEELVAPEQIAAHILRKLIADATEFLGEPVTDAVITVPAYFNDAQRQATKDAGEVAGVNVLRIVNEPTAAALAYGLHRRNLDNVVVFDLGGGTFDVSVLHVAERVCEVRATSGDTHLGGDDFDKALVEWILAELDAEFRDAIRNDRQAMQRLLEGVERAKCELSERTATELSLPFLASINGETRHLQAQIGRERVEEILAPLFARCVPPLQMALEIAQLKPETADDILLVGGSTRIPRLRDLVRETFCGKEPKKNVNPDEVVALGAAVQGAILSGQIDDLVLLDVTPFSLGIETHGGKVAVIVERNSSIPTRQSQMFSTAQHFQRAADVVILQGEHSVAEKNRELGRFALEGITRHVKGEAQIEVAFDLDENGILTVIASDLDGERAEKLVIEGVTTLSAAEKKEMVLSVKKGRR